MGIKFFLEKGWDNSDPIQIPVLEPTYLQEFWEGLVEMKDELVEVLNSEGNTMSKGIVIAFLSILLTVFFVFFYAFYECFKQLKNKEPIQNETTEKKLKKE